MTKRKTPTKQASQASTEAIESVEAKTNTTVAKRPKKANSTTTGASKRTRSKKVVVPEAKKEVDVDSRTITYIDPMTMAAKQEPKPSLYDRFVGWLTYKLYYYTSYFRGY